MITTPKSGTQTSELLTALTATGIRQTSPGGKARAFCDAVADQLGSFEARFYNNLAQTLLPFATGDSLDFLGQIYGVDRIPQQDIVSPASDGNFTFYVRRGTFGSINGGRF